MSRLIMDGDHTDEATRARHTSRTAAAVWFLFFAAVAAAQDGSRAVPQKNQITAAACSPSSSQLKAAAAKLRAEHSDSREFISALDAAFGFDTGYMDSHSDIFVGSRDGLSITLLFPYQAYRIGLREALRKREPIGDVPVPSGVVINVSPGRIDSPDIIKLIVERAGKSVVPVVNSLRPTSMTTRIGAKAVLHAGQVAFPCSAFAPGERVHIVAIPAVGENLERDVPEPDLRAFLATGDTKQRLAQLTEARQSTAASLLHQSGEEVERRLGKPDRVDGHRWSYGSGPSMLSLYLDDSNIVTGVQPTNLDLRTIKRQ